MAPVWSSQKMTPAAMKIRPATSRGSASLLRRSRLTAFLLRAEIEDRTQRDAAANRDEQQRPGVVEVESEQMQAHDLQPCANGDQPQPRPHRLADEQLRDADQDDDHRPEGADHVA